MLENFFNNETLKTIFTGSSCEGSSCGESISLSLIPGASVKGTSASLGSVAGSVVNVLFIMLFIIAVYTILKSTIRKVRSEGEPKGNEVFFKVVRNTVFAIITMIVFYLVINVVWIVFTGVSLFAAPNALRECGGVSVFDYTKGNLESGNEFYNCVNGKFR